MLLWHVTTTVQMKSVLVALAGIRQKLDFAVRWGASFCKCLPLII
jgi:hypothetical protein